MIVHVKRHLVAARDRLTAVVRFVLHDWIFLTLALAFMIAIPLEVYFATNFYAHVSEHNAGGGGATRAAYALFGVLVVAGNVSLLGIGLYALSTPRRRGWAAVYVPIWVVAYVFSSLAVIGEFLQIQEGRAVASAEITARAENATAGLAEARRELSDLEGRGPLMLESEVTAALTTLGAIDLASATAGEIRVGQRALAQFELYPRDQIDGVRGPNTDAAFAAGAATLAAELARAQRAATLRAQIEADRATNEATAAGLTAYAPLFHELERWTSWPAVNWRGVFVVATGLFVTTIVGLGGSGLFRLWTHRLEARRLRLGSAAPDASAPPAASAPPTPISGGGARVDYPPAARDRDEEADRTRYAGGVEEEPITAEPEPEPIVEEPVVEEPAIVAAEPEPAPAAQAEPIVEEPVAAEPEIEPEPEPRESNTLDGYRDETGRIRSRQIDEMDRRLAEAAVVVKRVVDASPRDRARVRRIAQSGDTREGDAQGVVAPVFAEHGPNAFRRLDG